MPRRPPGSDSEPPPEPKGPGRKLPQTDPTRKPFLPEILDRTVIAIPLLEKFREERLAERGRRRAPEPRLYPVIIDLNLDFPGGRAKAREAVEQWIEKAISSKATRPGQGIQREKSNTSNQYVFATLERRVIEELVRINGKKGPGQSSPPRAIYRIWPDFVVRPLLNRSVATVKADAARISFSAEGKGIVWAIMDSGIQGSHLHFQEHRNLYLPAPLQHLDFTGSPGGALDDRFGHGTHVAGIVAGGISKSRAVTLAKKGRIPRMATRQRDEHGEVIYDTQSLESISGVAPQCKLLSLKVLDDEGNGMASNLIAALAQIQELNGHGRRIVVHGVNMSVGYDFEPEWFACGQSPLCVEVNRLVRSGVVVVVAAGNTGYGYAQTAFRGTVASGMDLTINDPGNAELAVTVGSTHRDAPHIYGVSYFSSKGPTGDGRAKPDLVAPGEKIVSCAAGKPREELRERIERKVDDCDYREDSGTSMAAPHVSGSIAAFLSIRGEFIGQPEKVKEIFMASATDLKREKYFQGRGLVDLMRAIQSV